MHTVNLTAECVGEHCEVYEYLDQDLTLLINIPFRSAQ